MSWAGRLGELTDARTIERGRAYADGGRVAGLVEDGDRLTALVRGTEGYRVELVAGSMSWFCDCPVGASGAFCKHCVAVAIAAAGGGTEPGPADLTAFEPRPGGADDLTVLADEVARAFTPRRRFYDYDQANAYADAAEATVGLLVRRVVPCAGADRPGVDVAALPSPRGGIGGHRGSPELPGGHPVAPQHA